VTVKKPTRTEILISGRMKAIDRNRARSGQARQRVEAAIHEMERTGRQLTNAAIHTLADVHENWLYEHADVKAHADRVRAQIRQDRITAAAAGQTELAEQIKTENAQLLARNKSLVKRAARRPTSARAGPGGPDGRNDQRRRARPRRCHARSHLRP
jgi:hypothetical protein